MFDKEFSAPEILLLATVAIIIVMVIEVIKGLNKKYFCNICEKEYKLKDLLPQNSTGRKGILLCKKCFNKLKNKKIKREEDKKCMQKL
jgi:hypothetical protein